MSYSFLLFSFIFFPPISLLSSLFSLLSSFPFPYLFFLSFFFPLISHFFPYIHSLPFYLLCYHFSLSNSLSILFVILYLSYFILPFSLCFSLFFSYPCFLTVFYLVLIILSSPLVPLVPFPSTLSLLLLRASFFSLFYTQGTPLSRSHEDKSPLRRGPSLRSQIKMRASTYAKGTSLNILMLRGVQTYIIRITAFVNVSYVSSTYHVRLCLIFSMYIHRCCSRGSLNE